MKGHITLPAQREDFTAHHLTSKRTFLTYLSLSSRTGEPRASTGELAIKPFSVEDQGCLI